MRTTTIGPENITTECGGLPLALKTFDRHMAEAGSIDEWESTLKHLHAEHLQANAMSNIMKCFSTKIEMLPESLSNLRSLIFLDVSNCNNLKWLHQGIGNHKFMLHLNVESTDLMLLPVGISKLVSLEALKGVKFTSRNAANTNTLKLRHLKGLTRLEQLSIDIDEDHPDGTFGGMENMRILSCRNSSLDTNFITLPEDMNVMKCLEIVRLYKCVVPQWMFELQTVMELELQVSRDTAGDDFQELRNIPNLRKLHLRFFSSFPQNFGEAKAFPKLEELFLELSDFNRFPLLEDDAMPKLKRLRLQECSYKPHSPCFQILKNLKVLVTSLSACLLEESLKRS